MTEQQGQHYEPNIHLEISLKTLLKNNEMVRFIHNSKIQTEYTEKTVAILAKKEPTDLN